MFKAMLTGLRLRCPNCGEGRISEGLFHIHETCPVCKVRFERRSGESAGASIVFLSLLPIPALILGIIMMVINPDTSLWLVIGIPALFVLVMSAVGYRHARGLWIGVVAATDGLKTDAEADAGENPA